MSRKKTIASIISSCFILIFIALSTAVKAAPVNLPSGAVMSSDDMEYGNDEPFYLRLKKYPVRKKFFDIHGGIDASFDYLEKRKTAMDTWDVPVDLEGQFYTVNLLVSFAERVELYSELGILDNMKFIANDSGLKTIVGCSNGVFLYGAGIGMTLFSFDNGLSLFSDTRYRATGEFKPDTYMNSPDLFPGAVTTQAITDSQAKYEQWQSALGLSKKIFGDSSKKLIAFLGGIYSGGDAFTKGTVTGTSEWPGLDVRTDWVINFDFGSLEAKNNFGGFAGISFITNDEDNNCALIELQCRFIDELSFSLKAGYRF